MLFAAGVTRPAPEASGGRPERRRQDRDPGPHADLSADGYRFRARRRPLPLQHRRPTIPGLRQRHRRDLPGPRPSGAGRGADRAGAEAVALLEHLHHPRPAGDGREVRARHLRRHGVLRQFGLRGGRARHQDDPQVPPCERQPAQDRDRLHEGRVPRPDAGDDLRRRAGEPYRRLRPGGRGIQACRLRQHERAARRHRRRGRRHPVRTDPGRRRLPSGARRFPGKTSGRPPTNSACWSCWTRSSAATAGPASSSPTNGRP